MHPHSRLHIHNKGPAATDMSLYSYQCLLEKSAQTIFLDPITISFSQAAFSALPDHVFVQYVYPLLGIQMLSSGFAFILSIRFTSYPANA